MAFNPYTNPQVAQVLAAQKLKWQTDYEQMFVSLCRQQQFIEGGKFCEYARSQGLGEPTHHNAWPAQIATMKKKGYIAKAGEVEPSTRHSHIKTLNLWESKLYQPVQTP